MPKPKNVALQDEAEDATPNTPEVDEVRQELEELYATMKKLNINSISDVEVRLSRY